MQTTDPVINSMVIIAQNMAFGDLNNNKGSNPVEGELSTISANFNSLLSDDLTFKNEIVIKIGNLYSVSLTSQFFSDLRSCFDVVAGRVSLQRPVKGVPSQHNHGRCCLEHSVVPGVYGPVDPGDSHVP